MGVMYLGDDNPFGGYPYVAVNVTDPYYTFPYPTGFAEGEATPQQLVGAVGSFHIIIITNIIKVIIISYIIIIIIIIIPPHQ
jgi:hypothetical protein